ncbi:hypothetical protein CORC01_08771 [Colletotrichum orchidophilum]|uniref:Uncharacterized protein n=1 Tax=Colletotrichum orchidophilum TaxID=1209926 RepID=A0A1G4B3B4_9PEZI|nr:uncharacterized protein CORC01_08771 [Colletotrichum orchidophilum]OHE95919.1 hypothetical protein CORC01_08771 [Colletotrichum orchidophilum]
MPLLESKLFWQACYLSNSSSARGCHRNERPFVIAHSGRI